MPSNTKDLTDIEFLVLQVLSEGSSYGYRIAKDIAILTDGALTVRIPSLYGSLRRLEKANLISKGDAIIERGRARQTFEITRAGNQAILTKLETIRRLEAASRRTAGSLKRTADEL